MSGGVYHQVVPRPEHVGPGEVPSWADHFGTSVSIPLDAVRRAFGAFDPDEHADGSIVSSVLVPVLEVAGEATLVLTRRSSRLERDPGNVSFPGGRLDPGEHPLAAALREADEEIGLSPALVEVIGCLPLVDRRRDGEVVTPYVGLLTGQPSFSPNFEEVEAMLTIPLASLYNEGVAWEERWGQPSEDRRVRFFADETHLGSDLIWGLTARVIWEFLDRLSTVVFPAPDER